jgi:membrane-associated protein
VQKFLEFIRHLDKHIIDLTNQYGMKIYLILALIIFAETAFVIFPFLPGDSLLFAVGMIAANEKNNLSVPGLFILLTAAAVIGNVVNYWIGRFFGERLFNKPNSKIFSQATLKKTNEFFDNYGGKAIVITRFVPVVRAFAPFVAGMGAMEFPKFMIYNVVGGALWVGVCMFAGVFLGDQPWIKDRFEIAILVLVIISTLPIVIEWVLHRRRAKEKAAQEAKTSE